MKFATKAIHAAESPDSYANAIMPPIYMTSTFTQESPGVTKGYDYTRGGNPNFTILEKQLASMEDADYATVFSSGLGALTALIATLKPGDKVIAIDSVYGGTYRLFTKVFKNFGIEFEIIIPKNSEDLENHLSEKKTKWLLFETPTNPLLNVFDIEKFSKSAKKFGVTTIVDNTFATPYFQNPLNLGADIVWHSTTKYIGGHSDTIGGAMITRDKSLKEKLDFSRMALGLNPSPFDVWLTTRGVKTLALRMEKHEKNAKALVNYLKNHPLVEKIYYPGLEDFPNHLVAKKQMSGFGGMISIEFKLSLNETKNLIKSFKYFALAESLGGVESLVNHPALMTHASIPKEERQKIGINDGLVRFSCGIEDPDDLINDLKDNLNKI